MLPVLRLSQIPPPAEPQRICEGSLGSIAIEETRPETSARPDPYVWPSGTNRGPMSCQCGPEPVRRVVSIGGEAPFGASAPGPGNAAQASTYICATAASEASGAALFFAPFPFA